MFETTMDDRLALIGACGLYCGACPHFAGSGSPEASDGSCLGCHGSIPEMHPWCAECGIRACAEERELLHCGECADYPCEKTEAFHGDGKRHHAETAANIVALKTAGTAKWLDDQQQRWTCTCGTNFSWYQGLCYSCGEAVPSYAAA